MPGLCGPELCRSLRARESDQYTYIMLLTARQDTESVVAGLDAGADDFISKPFDSLELKARLTVGQRMLALEDRLQSQHHRLEDLNQRLSRMAFTDPLMQVGNRRSFHDAMDSIHRNVHERGAAYGLVMADVDHFKRYNDSKGHRAGDEALAAVAAAMRVTLRGGDRLFRYGGEELVVVARTESSDALIGLAERLRQSVQDLRLEHAHGQTGVVTCSFGAIQIGAGGERGGTRLVQRGGAGRPGAIQVQSGGPQPGDALAISLGARGLTEAAAAWLAAPT